MTIEATEQLVLLETAPFAGGPARPPSARRSRKPVGGITLPLFGSPQPEAPAPVPAEEPPSDPRRAAVERAVAEALARREARRERAPDEADPYRDPIPTEETPTPRSESVPFDVRTFQFQARPRPTDRAALVSLLAQRLSGHVMRGNRFRAEAEEDCVEGHVEGTALSIAFSGASARTRWLPIVQDVARERGLAEPE